MIDTLIQYFQFSFVQYAFIVGVLISLCSSLLGVTLVLKRFSFIGDGLSHVAFGAISIATVLNLSNNMFLVLPITIISAILLLRTGKNTKIQGDAAIAMISVSALALGYLIMNIFSASANITGDVCSTLFGSTSILDITNKAIMESTSSLLFNGTKITFESLDMISSTLTIASSATFKITNKATIKQKSNINYQGI
jgi:zinc transport system permease protein